METKVVIKLSKKTKKPTNGILKKFATLAILFFALAYISQELFYNGNHSHAVVIFFVVCAGLSGIFLLLSLAILVSKLGD